MKRMSLILTLIIILVLSSCVTNSQSDLAFDDTNTLSRVHTYSNDYILKKVHGSLETVLESNPSRHILVRYTDKPTDLDVQALLDLNLEISYRCKYVNVIECAGADSDKVKTLAEQPAVASIEPLPKLTPFLDVSARAVKARESEEYSPNTAWELGYTGIGINIAIFDSGVDDDHPSLRGKFVAGADFSVPGGSLTTKDGSFNPDDNDGHGTSVAGIALGTGGQQQQYRGIAPDAGLIDLKVSGRTGGALMNALEWCIDNKNTDWDGNGPDEGDGIDVLSISLGDSANSDGTDSIAQLLNRVVDSGIVVVVAVGNEGPDNNGINSLAAADKVIAVGNLDIRETVDRSDDVIDSTSTRGPRLDDGDSDPYDELKPEVSAPGTNTMAPQYSVVGQRGNGYRNFGGSSGAAPHVSGICALMLQANPALSPKEVKEILKDTAEAKGESDVPEISDKYNYAYGFGSVDAYSAVRVAAGFITQNHKPEILEVTASPKFVELGGEVTIITTAKDPDGDSLGYNYTTSGGEITGTGSKVTWTAPDQTGSYEITAIVDDGRLYSDPETVIVTVEEEIENHAPVIENIYVSSQLLASGENATIRVTANDPDEDELFYEYKASGGSIIGVGSVVNWIAPQLDGKYTIQITVTDGELDSATEKIIMTVEGAGENKPPVINSILATPLVINTGGTVRIAVDASDPEGGKLVYVYTTTGGEITGSGPEVTLSAPDIAESVIVTVTVQDSGGLSDTDYIVIEVYQQNYPPQILAVNANPRDIKSDGTVEVLFTVKVDDRNGLDDIYRVTMDLSKLLGSDNQKLYDNGKQGDRTQNDGIYSISYLVPNGVSAGMKKIPVKVEDRYDESVSGQVTVNITSSANDQGDGFLGTGLTLPGFDSGILMIAVLGAAIFIVIKRLKKKGSR